MNILINIFAVIGFIVVLFFIFIIIYAIIRSIINRVQFEKYRDSLIKSGFLKDISKKIDDEEKEDLEKTGKGGKSITYEIDTGKKTIKNNRRKKDEKPE